MLADDELWSLQRHDLHPVALKCGQLLNVLGADALLLWSFCIHKYGSMSVRV
jgi:hypothetical protein